MMQDPASVPAQLAPAAVTKKLPAYSTISEEHEASWHQTGIPAKEMEQPEVHYIGAICMKACQLTEMFYSMFLF